MMKEQLSSSILAMMEAIRIDRHNEPDWQQFLHYLLRKNGADKALIKIPVNDNFRVITVFPDKNIGGKDHCSVPDYPFRYTHKTDLVLLRLYFSDEPAHQQCTDFMQVFSPHITNCINLAVQRQQDIQRHSYQQACSSRLNFAQLQLSCHGELLHANDMAQTLINQGLLKLSHQRLLLSTDRQWLKEMQKGVITGQIKSPTISKIIDWNDQKMRCTLLYQQHKKGQWHTDSHRFSLVIHPLLNQVVERWMTDQFDISAPEAKVGALYASGMSAHSVADQTGYSIHTVYSYIKSLYAASGVNKQAQLTASIWPNMP